MIVIFLRGGLGNQIFQYALGRNLAEKYKTELVFDTTFLNDRFPRGGVSFYKYDLDAFGITPRLTALSQLSEAMPVPGVWLGTDLVLMKLRDRLGIRKIIKEGSPAFDPRVLESGASALLWGYWQSEKYFKNVARDLRAEFGFVISLEGTAQELAKNIKNTNSVALHVRRGDYVTAASTKQLMGDTNTAYYNAAIAYIAERVKDPHFFVVSNDPVWCKEHIKLPFPVMYLDDTSAGPKNIYHMQLMSLCKHNIIANSTFSWWGAWLNANPNKIVIAPKRWYADPAMSDQDVVPAGWIRM